MKDYLINFSDPSFKGYGDEIKKRCALRDFRFLHIFQRKYFAEFGFDKNLDDEEILYSEFGFINAPVGAYDEKFQTVDELERNTAKLEDLVSCLDSYLELINRHCRRLERYINAAANFIAEGTVADVEGIRHRYKIGQSLKSLYTTLYIEIKFLKDKTDKAFKRLYEKTQYAYRKIFGDRLKFARRETKMSQRTFAEKLGLTQNGYSPYENGQRNPSIPMLIRLSKILGRSADWLLGQTAW